MNVNANVMYAMSAMSPHRHLTPLHMLLYMYVYVYIYIYIHRLTQVRQILMFTGNTAGYPSIPLQSPPNPPRTHTHTPLPYDCIQYTVTRSPFMCEEFTRLAETRLAQHTLTHNNIAQLILSYMISQCT